MFISRKRENIVAAAPTITERVTYQYVPKAIDKINGTWARAVISSIVKWLLKRLKKRHHPPSADTRRTK